MVRIQKVQDPIYEISDTWVDALNVYSTAYEEGTLSMEPVPHGRFDNNAIDMGISPPAEDSGNQSPKRYYIPAPHEFAPPARGNRVYVVLKGEAVGIFSTWYTLHFFNFSQHLYVNLLGIKSLFVSILFIPPQIPPESAGIRELRRIPPESTGILGIPPESIGIHRN